jgi:hypothetical protein
MRAMRPPQNRFGRPDAIDYHIEKTADDQSKKKKDDKHNKYILENRRLRLVFMFLLYHRLRINTTAYFAKKTKRASRKTYPL